MEIVLRFDFVIMIEMGWDDNLLDSRFQLDGDWIQSIESLDDVFALI